MNASRKKFDRFSVSFPHVSNGGQPCFQPVRIRQNLSTTKKTQLTDNVSNQSSLQGILKFPVARRSGKSDNTGTCSSSNDYFFLKPKSSVSLNKNFTIRLESESAFPSASLFPPQIDTFFQTPENIRNHLESKSTSAANKRCLLQSVSTSDSQFFTTPRKRSSAKTPKSSSSAVSDPINNVVVAITEGRGQTRGEVGIAAIDIKRPILTLCEISDTQTYVNTLSKINVLNPMEILVPSTFHDTSNPSKLYQMVYENFPNTTLMTVQRKFFNENSGLQQIQTICLPEYSSVLLVISRKFYALAAAAAALKYAEFEQNVTFSPRSIRVNYESGNNITFIDLKTAQKLELVISQNMGNVCPENTLYGVLNNCNTISGQRRLRSLLLQPSTDEKEINKRLDCVEELVNNQDLFFPLKTVLPKFWDVEQLLSLCTQIANLKDNSRAVELQINYILLLKTSLEAIPSLQKCLSKTNVTFFSSFCKNLDNMQYKNMLHKIYEIINEDAHLSPKFDICQFQRCFCIKTGVDAFLDVARLAYTELVEDFNGVVDDLITEYQLPLTVKTLRSKGPILQMKLKGFSDNFNVKDLPSVFIQVEKSRSSITMTTKELLFLKERMNHFIQEIQLLSSVIIFEMMKEIRQYVGSLFVLCENIAELDLVVSFAQISKSFAFVRPIFSVDCTKLNSSEHPILHRVSLSKPVANDVFASANSNMSIITGPNMGGKSIYIRQIALLQIMAQSGCYVPAEFAQFRITDRIFSRLGFNDDIECNASSFMVELKEMHYIMRSLTPRSLVIVDELCRGTSTEEGTSLAWAVLEELLASTAFIFVTTHFVFLTKLEEFYCNVTNWHFDTLEIDSNDENALPSLVYTHRLVPGVMKLEHYGLKLARITAISDNILQSAEAIVTTLNAEWKVTSIFEGDVHDDKKIDNIILKMLEMLHNQALTVSNVKALIEHAVDVGLSVIGRNENDFEDRIQIESIQNEEPVEPLSDSEDTISENTQLNVEERNNEIFVEMRNSSDGNMGSDPDNDSQTGTNEKSVHYNSEISDSEENPSNDDESQSLSYASALDFCGSSAHTDYNEDQFSLSQDKFGQTCLESKSFENEILAEQNFCARLFCSDSTKLNEEPYQGGRSSSTLDNILMRVNFPDLPEKSSIHFYSA